ncbi:MAG: ATP-binding cassette domain-containing protein [Candidatus Paceibacterota bacterium]|jgi:ABC-type polar amino acid transport system ATPase subunit
MLEGKNLKKQYHGREILKGIDISVEAGKIVSLIGPSGSGKTTLLRVLSMLDPANSGAVIFEGQEYKFPMREENIIPPWPRISVVFQQLFLWPHLTLKENILLPLGGVQESKQMEELIDLFQMRGFIERYPNQASLGQKQRVALVRALVLNPEYLLLDEITSALDIEQVGIILNYLQGLKNKGVGILLVTHLLNFAKRASDQIVFLDEGQILERGDANILKNPDHPRIKKFISLIESAS